MTNSIVDEINYRNAQRRRGVDLRRHASLVSRKPGPETKTLAYAWRMKILDRRRKLLRAEQTRQLQETLEAGRPRADVQFDGNRDDGAGTADVTAPKEGTEQAG